MSGLDRVSPRAYSQGTFLSGKADTAGVNERSSRPGRCAGVVATACTQGKRTQHGRPQGVVRDDQPDARERWLWQADAADSCCPSLAPPRGANQQRTRSRRRPVRNQLCRVAIPTAAIECLMCQLIFAISCDCLRDFPIPFPAARDWEGSRRNSRRSS
jgi:hypothetical protein